MVASSLPQIIQSIRSYDLSLVAFPVADTYVPLSSSCSFTESSRYRIPINKSLHSRFKRYSYLEIMLDPAGGMPYMYVMQSQGAYLPILILLQLSDKGNFLPYHTDAGETLVDLCLYPLLSSLSLALPLCLCQCRVNRRRSELQRNQGDYIYGVYLW